MVRPWPRPLPAHLQMCGMVLNHPSNRAEYGRFRIYVRVRHSFLLGQVRECPESWEQYSISFAGGSAFMVCKSCHHH